MDKIFYPNIHSNKVSLEGDEEIRYGKYLNTWVENTEVCGDRYLSYLYMQDVTYHLDKLPIEFRNNTQEDQVRMCVEKGLYTTPFNSGQILSVWILHHIPEEGDYPCYLYMASGHDVQPSVWFDSPVDIELVKKFIHEGAINRSITPEALKAFVKALDKNAETQML